MKDIKSFLAHLSHHPGIYQMLDQQGKVLYVGKAKDLKKRVASYFSKQITDPKTLALVKQIADIDVTITASETDAVLLECNLIKKWRPRYNILLRDDKSYPYIYISAHPSPRIDLYRGKRKEAGRTFGPFPNSIAVRETIQLLQKLFRLRTCSDSYFDARSRPCLLYQINRCTAPCVNLVSHDDYAEQVRLAVLFLEGKSDQVIASLQQAMQQASSALQYELAGYLRDQIARIRQVQHKQQIVMAKGEADVIGFAIEAGVACLQLLSIRDGDIIASRAYFPSIPLGTPEEMILSAFLSQHYLADRSHIESIPKEIIIDQSISDKTVLSAVLSKEAGREISLVVPIRGTKKKWLEMARQSARQSLTLHLFRQSSIDDRLHALQVLLNLDRLPARIECFDISHTAGEATVASCVVYTREGIQTSDYRRYNITGLTPGDDVAAMHQVLSRRFSQKSESEMVIPDVILIDGGQAQLNTAIEVLKELPFIHASLVGVSKGPGRKAGFESLHRPGHAPIHLPHDSLALHLIQQIRDEAHRFAITGHRKQRDKARRQSSLEQLAGIGPKRRRALLRYFGGIQGVAHASLDELASVPGINLPLAERIFAAFHDTTV